MIGRYGLFPKYAAALMITVGSLVLASGTVELRHIYAEVRDAAGAVQRAEARAAAVRIEQFLGGIRTTLAEGSKLPWGSQELPDRDQREEYHRLLKILPAVAELRSVDATGKERLRISRVAMDVVGGGRDLADPEALAVTRDQGFSLGLPYFRDGSEPFAVMAVPERSGGATLADIDLKFVTDVVRQIQLGEHGKVYVVDGAHRLVAHPNLDLVLRKTELSSYEPLRQLRASMGEANVAGMIDSEGLEKGPVLLSAALIPSVGWMVVTEQPRAEILAPVYAALTRTAWLVAAALLAALVVSYWLARRLSGPILEVRRGAEKIAAGDLAARIDVRTGDEVEALSREFNRMAAQLEEYTVSLERKVEEKTAALTAADRAKTALLERVQKEREAAEQALQVAREAMRAKALFLAAASHDLRQPLYAISILADTLALGPLPEGGAAVLEQQRQAIAILRSLFDNLLDLSRFDAGEVQPTIRAVSLREVFAPLAGEYEFLCTNKGLAWRCELEDAWVRTDPNLVCRLAANLLSNAVRYTPKGSVTLRAAIQDGQIAVLIADTGIGIAPADQARVFEEFVQLANPARDRDRGVGLGLSIVRKIAELLDARLSLASRPGEGTTVRFQLPISEAPLALPASALLPLPSAPLAGLRLWVVEDDAVVRAALGLQLSAMRIDHAFAANRPELTALREHEGRWPDAVMVDDMLGPGEGGLEIARWLRAHLEAERILIVTGNVDRERLAQLKASGLAVLRKPLASSELLQWLHRVAAEREVTTADRAAERAG